MQTKYIPAIISNLENIKCAQNARNILRLYNQELVLPKLISQLKDIRTSDKLKIGIIRCMTEYNQAIVIDIYKEFLNVGNSNRANHYKDVFAMILTNVISKVQNDILTQKIQQKFENKFKNLKQDILKDLLKENPKDLLKKFDKLFK